MSLKDLTLQEIIDMALEHVPTDFDKRTGSIIYDTISSVAVPILFLAMESTNIESATFIESSYGNYVDMLVADKGIVRKNATKAIKKARVIAQDKSLIIDIGTRFSTVDNNSLIYTVIKYIGDFEYLVECDTAGTIGNSYFGNLIPISFIPTLATAEIIDDYQEGKDEESDDDLKQRYLSLYDQTAFGGNISQYREEVKKLDGVGELQVYRAFPSSGHVTLSIISPSYKPISKELIQTLQNTIDPTINNQQGTGLGLAPIFHKVHITTPVEFNVPIQLRVQLANGYNIESIKPNLQNKIEELFISIRKEWAVLNTISYEYEIIIYISRIIALALNVEGVINVSEVKINSQTKDLILIENGSRQELPFLGVLDIYE